MALMKIRLDPDSPVPLYHQIAEAIRYRVATGALAPGAPLPPLREAAELWGVNLHTARRAYAELARERLVETRPQTGTRVLGGAAVATRRARTSATSEFLARIVREAREAHGLTLDQLVAALGNAGAEDSAGVVHVVECSETQSTDLARQIEARWRVDARPWSLEWPGEPPPGPVVATYFHYNDVRCRWPARLATVRFVAIRPDPSLVERLAEGRIDGPPKEVTLCEREPAMAANIAADLTGILPPDRFRVVRRVADEPKSLLDRQDGGPVLFSPRVWGELDPAERANPRAVEVRYVLDRAELEALGDQFGWPPR
jgi:DNA-binding transcriptional regulator YhcF (GntR family)